MSSSVTALRPDASTVSQLALAHHARDRPIWSVKILVAGGFGVGKTTFVASVSEIAPLRTEAVMTQASTGVDDVAAVPGKTTTTVAMDFGRITIDDGLILYLFGTPGQDRFWYMWDELARGAIGAVVVADTRRLADCYPAIDFFTDRGVPYVVALNPFPGADVYPLDEVRQALNIAEPVPMVSCDARDRGQVRQALIRLTEHAIHTRRAMRPSNAS